jgi:hypothetical protein
MSLPKLSPTSTLAITHFKHADAIEQACNDLLAALEAATPKFGDYIALGPNAHYRAVDAHRGRILAVRGIRGHAQCLAQHVADQLQAVESTAA